MADERPESEVLKWKHDAITVTGRTASLRGVVKDSLGRRLCRWCGALVERPRLSWCGDACVKEYKEAIALTTSEGQREYLDDRERGVCQSCELDTDRLLARMRRAYRLLMHFERVPRQGRNTPPYRQQRKHAMVLIGRVVGRRIGREPGKLSIDRTWWEADHITPLIEGGTHTGDNLRTLCIWCHREETAALARRRTEDSRQEKLALGESG